MSACCAQIEFAYSGDVICAECSNAIGVSSPRIYYSSYYFHVLCLIQTIRIKTVARCIQCFPGIDHMERISPGIMSVLASLLYPKQLPSRFHIINYIKSDLFEYLNVFNIKYTTTERKKKLRKKVLSHCFERKLNIIVKLLGINVYTDLLHLIHLFANRWYGVK